jgi:phthalate 4,5-cis-dihydrodiol dehydrogenase
MNWTGEMGQKKQPGVRAARSFTSEADEIAFKNARNYGGANYQPAGNLALAHQHFGVVIVSCERADLRPLPDGVMIYDKMGSRLDPLPAPAIPRAEVVDELYDAVVNGVAPTHDGAWAMATLEVCLAMLASSREGRDIALSHQVSR